MAFVGEKLYLFMLLLQRNFAIAKAETLSIMDKEK